MAFGTLCDRGTENEKRAVDGMMERGNLVLPISESCRLLIRLHYSCVVLTCEPVVTASTSYALRRQSVVGLHGAAHFLPQRTVCVRIIVRIDYLVFWPPVRIVHRHAATRIRLGLKQGTPPVVLVRYDVVDSRETLPKIDGE